MAKTTDCLDWAGIKITIHPFGAAILDHQVRVGILDLSVWVKTLDHLDPESLNGQDSMFDINKQTLRLIEFQDKNELTIKVCCSLVDILLILYMMLVQNYINSLLINCMHDKIKNKKMFYNRNRSS